MNQIVNYKGFEITVKTAKTRFGTLYTAVNNIGEPYMDAPAFTTAAAAVAQEKANIDSYLND